ncbi:MAG: Ig-like domain-containing protein [Clostridia bacterium]|nr:Ig-like domain-containing protein [Clostridia bacterium]
MTKRILAFLMCAVMIFSSVPFSPLSEFFDFAVSAVAAENSFEVYFDEITVLVNAEGTLTPVATFGGEVVTDNLTYKWTSRDTSIATVDENGRVKGIKAGEVTVNLSATYTYMGVNYTYAYGSRIKVLDFIPVDSLKPVGGEKLSIMEQSTERIKVSVEPATATYKELRWKSSNENVVKILSSGLDSNNPQAYADIYGAGEGTATVTYTATDGTNKSGSFTVTVNPLIKTLSLPPHVVVTESTTGYAVDRKILPATAVKKDLEWWSANTNVCLVDALGVITPKGAGVTYVSARTTDGSNITAKTYVVVSDGTKSITLDKTSLAMKVGDKNTDLTATCELSGGITYTDAVEWKSSNTAVATVDSLGIVKAVGPGTAKITATTADGTNLKAECTVSVTQPVKGISLPKNAVCWVGGTMVLSPAFEPSNASDKKVTWSTDNPNVATVSDKGIVSGKSEGKAEITVKTNDGGYIAVCEVSVEVPPTSVSLSKTALSLRVGSSTNSSETLIATVNPDTATNKNVSWTSSDTKVATVDSDGKVTAVAGGTATITCTTKSGGAKATCRVTVSEDATSIRITNAPTSKLYKEQKYQLKIEFNSATVTNKTVVWTSSNSGAVSVDRNTGMLTARGANLSSTITATYTTYDGRILTAQCTVFTEPKVEVTGVTLNMSKKTVYTKVGSTVYLYETVSPDNASDKTVAWSTSNAKVASVSNGTVTANAPGKAKIQVKTTDGEKTDYCEIYVVGPIELYSTSVQVPVGSTSALILAASSNPSDMPITWTSSDTKVATVDANGMVKGIKAGTVTVTASTPNNLYRATCKVNVVIPVTGVKINYSSLTVPKGEKRSVTATVSPANATDQRVTWTAGSSVISVSSTGQVEGKRVGSTTLTVTTNDGRYVDVIDVDVIQPVTSLSFEYSSITLDAGKKKTLSPEIRPVGATNKDVKWSSSNKKIATVSSSGVVTAVAAGTATVTCASADGYAKTTVKVTVTQPPTGIKFKSKKTTVRIGTPKKFNPIILPETASNKNVIWSSSDEKIAKVAADGTVTGLKKGTVKITATTANSLYSATIKVEVIKPVKKVKLNKTSITIAVGKTTTITPTISPKSASNKEVTWKSSDNDVVKVKNGKITAKAPGYAVITCTSVDSGKKAECTVFVNQPVKSVKLNKTKAIIDIDEKLTLKATIKPSDASNKALKWTSSNKKVVKVTSKGVVKPVSTGTATITVITKDGGLKATCKVTVVKRVKSVSLPKTLTVYLGEKDKLDAVLNPKKPSNPDVKWKSSKKSVATVSKSGTITPKKTGTANITVTTDDGGLKATCKVSVKRKLKSFTLNKKKLTLDAGKTYTLKVTRKPSNATEGITFTSSNKKVATVSSKGVITAKGRGTATITAKSERGITVKCKITVKQPVTSIYISKTSASVYMGEGLTLKANVLPTNANNQKFTWSVSDTSVLTVSGGKITPKKVGTAVITVKSENGKKATCTVTVKQHVTAVSVDRSAVSLERGATAALKVTVSPANATEKGYTFASSNTNIATVSATGVITAKAPGTATVTVTSKENNKTATCKVTVIERVVGVELNETAETLYIDKYGVGQTMQLAATVSPANATDKAVTWASSDSSVAKVSANGLVTAVKSGVALITVTTADGKKTADCTVTVLQHVTGITLEKAEITVNRDAEVWLNATVEPADAFNKNITWTPENEGIATVDKYGKLTGVNCGETTVYATTDDGDFTASCHITVNEPVTGIVLDITEVPSLYRDEQVKLTPTVYPDSPNIGEYINKTVIWTSSDESIAAVDENGTVTAVGAGEAVITATTADGGFEATCRVTCFMPVEEITTEADDFYIKIGEAYSQSIVATILPENASFPEVRWEILSGDEYFTCDSGVITGLSMGSGRVRIISVDNPGVTKEINIHIVKKVDGVVLDKTDVTLNKGETSTLIPTVSPSDAHNQKVTFTSSDENVVSVDENGVVTAVGRGTATVTVTTEDEGKTAECTFTVKQLVEEIVFTESEYTVGAGKKLTLGVQALPENANDKTLKWESSESSVATVANGTVTGIRAGETLITATAADTGRITATVKVTVVKHAEAIELTAETDNLWIGDSVLLNALVLPEDTTDKTVTFTSSDESIATVDENGLVTALSAGETGTAEVVITALSACTSAAAEYTFTVRQQITDIIIPDTSVILKLGESYTFGPEVLPVNAFDKTVTYTSSDKDILTVEDGKVTTVGTGTATVTLTSACGKVEKTCEIKIIVLPAEIEMEAELSVEKNKTHQLTPVLTPDNVTETKVIYTSSDEEVAKVDENGLVTALKAGNAVIKAQTETEDVYAECKVSVYVLSEKIELTAERYELYIGEEFTLGAAVLPEDTTNKNVTFTSSADEVITVDGEGKVKAVGKGTATVTVTAEDTGITSVCEVTVRKHAEAINVVSDAVAYVGRGLKIEAEVLPADADNKNIIWTVSDERMAGVDADGVLTAYEPGFVFVTAETEDGGFKGGCLVEIRTGIDSVSLSKTELLLDRGASETLAFSVLPENADVKKVIWTTSDDTVATVDSKGKVTATDKSGTAVIRATAVDNPEAYAECTVTVKVPLITIYLQESEIGLRKGETASLKVVYQPENATVKDVIYESADADIASVDENGVVTAHKAGEADITVTSLEGGYKTVCRVKVYKEIEGFISLPLIMKKGAEADIYTVFAAQPIDHDEKLSFTCDNEDIADVSENGIITAKARGTANIIITSSISGKTYTLPFTVIEPVAGVEFVKDRETVVTNGITAVEFSVLPADADNIESIVFISENEEIAKIIDQTDGSVQGMDTGTVKITVKVTTTDGEELTDTYTLTVVEAVEG